MALERYERHLPLIDGRVAPPKGFRLDLLEVGQEGEQRHGRHRHERMLGDGAFDIAEVSLSSYLMARDRGLPFTAVPVFPRRLFSQMQMFVRADSPIRAPRELAGKRVALQSFQTTLAVLAKGDLAFAYGVPWRSITWHVRDHETVALPSGMDAKIVRVPRTTDLPSLLAEGEVDALFYSRYPQSPNAPPGRIRRLFPDPAGEALGYFRRYGWFPVMHVLALKQGVADANPTLPAALVSWHDAALEVCRMAYEDPAWLFLPFGRLAYETTLAEFGADPWPSGLRANRPYLARFIEYSRDQQLIARSFAPEELFHESVLDT
ncbi:MAG TPA: PhnD/SsuA/transferrin family substrate-binding protein [Stellaceae bacterium]|nr:PhnD/SsuA/transferrin family substrate-binding protein [Stellaceae bacterium]